ncbi:MAG TPA: 4,5-DOPA dioxygenase extradiol [Hymenobacter sp.]
MLTLPSLKTLADSLPEQDAKMPVLFVGHGSPMNAIEDNEFTQRWRRLGQEIPQPKAVLVVSAHWNTRGTFVTAMNRPQTIHDFGGFPEDLERAQYPAPGAPELARQIQAQLAPTTVGLNHDWGLDHGTWSITKQMYPQANIPVLQLSIDYTKPAEWHYTLGKQLAALRKKGVLIIGSGNMVHNLRMIHLPSIASGNPEYGYDWAIEMNNVFKRHIIDGNHHALIHYDKLGPAAKLAIPSPDHYLPLLYSLALQEKNEAPMIFNDKLMAGSLNMTSIKFG